MLPTVACSGVKGQMLTEDKWERGEKSKLGRSPALSSFYDETNADPGTDTASGSSNAPCHPRVLPFVAGGEACAKRDSSLPGTLGLGGRCSTPARSAPSWGSPAAKPQPPGTVGAEEPRGPARPGPPTFPFVSNSAAAGGLRRFPRGGVWVGVPAGRRGRAWPGLRGGWGVAEPSRAGRGGARRGRSRLALITFGIRGGASRSHLAEPGGRRGERRPGREGEEREEHGRRKGGKRARGAPRRRGSAAQALAAAARLHGAAAFSFIFSLFIFPPFPLRPGSPILVYGEKENGNSGKAGGRAGMPVPRRGGSCLARLCLGGERGGTPEPGAERLVAGMPRRLPSGRPRLRAAPARRWGGREPRRAGNPGLGALGKGFLQSTWPEQPGSAL